MEIKNLLIKYADGVLPSAFREIKAAEEANRLFEPFIERINEVNGRVVVTLPLVGSNRYELFDLGDELDALIDQNFPILLRRYNRHKLD